MNHTIYINGKRHRCTAISAAFYADSPELPGRQCSHHSIGQSAALHLRNGGSVRTGGNHYSLQPPMAEARVAPIKRSTPRVVPDMMDDADTELQKYIIRVAAVITFVALVGIVAGYVHG